MRVCLCVLLGVLVCASVCVLVCASACECALVCASVCASVRRHQEVFATELICTPKYKVSALTAAIVTSQTYESTVCRVVALCTR